MAKVVVLSAEQLEFTDIVTKEAVKMTKIELLKKIGKDHVVGTYYITEENPKGFDERMVAPNVFETEFVVDAEFGEAKDFKTGKPKIVLAGLTAPQG